MIKERAADDKTQNEIIKWRWASDGVEAGSNHTTQKKKANENAQKRRKTRRL
jgi:hypothetical protein